MTKILVSISEAAELLSIGKRTVHLLCAKGLLPAVRVGSRKLIRVADLLEFAKNGTSVAALRNIQNIAQ